MLMGWHIEFARSTADILRGRVCCAQPTTSLVARKKHPGYTMSCLPLLSVTKAISAKSKIAATPSLTPSHPAQSHRMHISKRIQRCQASTISMPARQILRHLKVRKGRGYCGCVSCGSSSRA